MSDLPPPFDDTYLPRLSSLELLRLELDLELLDAWTVLEERDTFDRATVGDAMRYAFELGREKGIDEMSPSSSPRNRGDEPASMAGRDDTTEAGA